MRPPSDEEIAEAASVVNSTLGAFALNLRLRLGGRRMEVISGAMLAAILCRMSEKWEEGAPGLWGATMERAGSMDLIGDVTGHWGG